MSELDLADLDLSEATMRAFASEVVDRVVRHLASLEQQPAMGDMDQAAALAGSAVFAGPCPEEGEELTRILDPLFDAASPGYLAFIPGGGLFPAGLADLIADGVNRYTGIAEASPALVALEAQVLDWLCRLLRLPSGARGLLTSGGSLATLGAVVAARHRHLGTRLREGVLYTSSQAHHSVAKAAALAGILPDRQRVLPVDDRHRLRLDALEDAIAADRRAGLVPFLVVSAAGTTNTGAVDPLPAIADLCAREGLWHHCDAAYGGFFYLVDEVAPALVGLERADSVTLDPHKGLFLPYGTGALLVRDGEALRAAHAVNAEYLPPLDETRYAPTHYGPELSRPFRGLRLWLPLKLFGLARFRAALAEKHALATWCAEGLAAHEGVSLLAPPPLSLFAFEATAPGRSAVEKSAATERWLAAVNERRHVLLSGTRIDGRFFARICVLCFRTRRRHMEIALRDLLETRDALRW
ncbi:MAG: aminotransferase class V-fold PLP-dependent enzyme [Polyangiaceae bacterium]